MDDRGISQLGEGQSHVQLAIVGAPSSAGAYAPGQEKTPAVLRNHGLLESLRARGLTIRDYGDTVSRRWSTDRANPRAMNTESVTNIAKAAATLVAAAFSESDAVLVLGGDCTVEIGTVAGALEATESIGLVYVDLDTDLNTPDSTTDGALDWMGVAHLLGVAGTLPPLASIGPRVPLLQPNQLLYFGIDNVEPCERQLIEQLRIEHVPLAEVIADPAKAAQAVASGWARAFDRLLVHVDLDILDFAQMPLAENTRRNVGLTLEQLLEALKQLLRAPNWAALTLCELNPDHGESDGSTLQTFIQGLADCLAVSRIRSE